MAGNAEPLDDHALDRELEALLAVDPSPEFNARVRTAVVPVIVTPWWLPRRTWLLAPAGLGAVALVAAILLRTSMPTSPSEGQANRSPHTASSRQTPVASGASAPALAPSTRVATTARSYTARGGLSVTTRPAILISSEEAQGLRALLTRVEPLHVRVVSAETAVTALPSGDIVALVVTPIVIKPLSGSEDPSEGVRQ